MSVIILVTLIPLSLMFLILGILFLEEKSGKITVFGSLATFLVVTTWLTFYSYASEEIESTSYYEIKNIKLNDNATVSVAAYYNKNSKGQELVSGIDSSTRHWNYVKVINVNEQLQLNISDPETVLLRVINVKSGPYCGLYNHKDKVLIDVVNKDTLKPVEK